MKTVQRNGNSYRIPSALSEFQEGLYLHLIDWKRAQITMDSGTSGGVPYDAILPDSYAADGRMAHLYPPIKDHLEVHRKKNPFQIHKHFYLDGMVSRLV